MIIAPCSEHASKSTGVYCVRRGRGGAEKGGGGSRTIVSRPAHGGQGPGKTWPQSKRRNHFRGTATKAEALFVRPSPVVLWGSQ